MRIIYYVDGLNRGGVENVVVQLSKHMAYLGHEVHVICLYKDMQEMVSELPASVVIHFLSFTNKKKPYSQYVSHYNELVHLLKEIRPHVVHAHNSSFSFFFLALAILKSRVRPVNIRTIHFMGFFLDRKGIPDKIRFYFDKKASQLLKTLIIPVSHAIERKICRLYFGNDVKTIENGVDLKQFPNIRKSKTNFSINENCLVGIYTSRICSGKNHHTLLKAWTEVVKDYPDALLVLVGDGPLKAECENYCILSGIQNNVMFTGSISNVSDYLCVADVGIFPSESEGFGLGVYEMMATGLPVIVSRIPAFETLITNGKNGFFFETYEWNDLYKKIKLLFSEKQLRSTVGHNAYESVRNEYSIKAMLQKHVDLYSELTTS